MDFLRNFGFDLYMFFYVLLILIFGNVMGVNIILITLNMPERIWGGIAILVITNASCGCLLYMTVPDFIRRLKYGT